MPSKSTGLPIKDKRQIERYTYNNVRVFAAFSVIVGHYGFYSITEYTTYNRAEWWIGNIYESFFRSGLPLFLLLTGVLLLPKATGYAFVLKRTKRVLIPFLIWSFAYAYINKAPGQPIFFIDLINVFEIKSMHLWFVYTILLIYILMPLLKYFWDKNPKLLMRIGIFSYTLSLLYFYVFYDYFDGIWERNMLHHVIVYSFYILIGVKMPFILRNKSLKHGIYFFGTGFIINLLGAFYLIKNDPFHIDHFYRSINMHIIIKAIGAFIIIKELTKRAPNKLNIVFEKLSKYCFGIYFIHPLVIRYAYLIKFPFKYHFTQYIYSIPLMSFGIFIVSFFIIMLLSKLPFGRYFY